MDRIRRLVSGMALAGLLAGCGGGGGSTELPTDQKDPAYNKQVVDEIQKTMPAPGSAPAGPVNPATQTQAP